MTMNKLNWIILAICTFLLIGISGCATPEKKTEINESGMENEKETTDTKESETEEMTKMQAAGTETETEKETGSSTEDGFVFYFQEDPLYADLPHGSSTISRSGCGTVSLAMVLSTLTGDKEAYSPDKLASFMEEEGIAPPNKSTEAIVTLCQKMNTGCTAVLHFGDVSYKVVDETLASGGFVILDQLAGDKKTFAGFNHYIVIRGGCKEEGYQVANSLYRFSKEGSTESYAPQNSAIIPAEEFISSYYYTITKDE